MIKGYVIMWPHNALCLIRPTSTYETYMLPLHDRCEIQLEGLFKAKKKKGSDKILLQLTTKQSFNFPNKSYMINEMLI